MLTEIFGTVAVAAMALFYALEHRSHGYLLGFSASCEAAAPPTGMNRYWASSMMSLISFLELTKLLGRLFTASSLGRTLMALSISAIASNSQLSAWTQGPKVHRTMPTVCRRSKIAATSS